MMQLKTGKYDELERKAITYVTACKMIESFGHYPPKEKLVTVSVYFADITGLLPSDFFEPKSHKGFLSKCVENSRTKLQAGEKRWTWTPRVAREKKASAVSLLAAGLSDPVATASTSGEGVLASSGAACLLEEDFTFVGCC